MCGLQWDWEYDLNGRRAFVIPEHATKNGNRISRMTNRAWRVAREQAALREVCVHDLRHSFAVRLRAANVAQEDIQDLLGHKKKTVTEHYATATIERLFACVDRLTDISARPAALLRRVRKVA